MGSNYKGMKDTVDDIIESAVQDIKSTLDAALIKKLDTALRRQNELPDPNNIYACLFTSYLMWFSYYQKSPVKAADYQAACLKAGAIGKRFEIKDHQKMALAAGFPSLVWQTYQVKKASDAVQKIAELCANDCPVVISLNGEHYEACFGFDFTGEEPVFVILDPGFQKDTFADAKTLEVFRVVSGARVYSKAHDGSRRKITRFYWFEENASAAT